MLKGPDIKDILRRYVLASALIALAATCALAGTVVYDYDPTGQLESVRATVSNTITWFRHDPSGKVYFHKQGRLM